MYHGLPIQPHTKSIGHTTAHAHASQSYSLSLYILVYADIMILLWFKYNHQKAESSRAASLSKLVNNRLIFNRELFDFPAPSLIYNYPYNTGP